MSDFFRDVFELALRLERIRTAPIPSLPIGFRRRDGPPEYQRPEMGVSPRSGATRGPQVQDAAGVDYRTRKVKP